MMPKSLPVNRLVGQGVTMWGVSLPIRLFKPSLARSRSQAWVLLQTLLLLSLQDPGPLGLAGLSPWFCPISPYRCLG